MAEGQHPSLHGAKLYSYKEAEAGGHSYWISAQVTPQYLTPRDGVVTLGDGQLYGGYLNYGPLNSEAGYQVAVAVTQSLGGESRVAVSDLVHIYTIYLHYLQYLHQGELCPRVW